MKTILTILSLGFISSVSAQTISKYEVATELEPVLLTTDFDNLKVRQTVSGLEDGGAIYTEQQIKDGQVTVMQDATQLNTLSASTKEGKDVNMIWRQADDRTGIWACFGTATNNLSVASTPSARISAPCVAFDDFSFWARADNGDLLLTVSIVDGNGATLHTYDAWTPGTWTDGGDYTWHSDVEGGGAAIPDSATGYAYVISAYNPTGGTTAFDLKNIDLNTHVCPEPSSTLLLGLGTMGLLIRRKRS